MVAITRLESGYYHIRGNGPCNWAQVPHWPCDYSVLAEHAFPEAGHAFLQECKQLIEAQETQMTNNKIQRRVYARQAERAIKLNLAIERTRRVRK